MSTTTNNAPLSNQTQTNNTNRLLFVIAVIADVSAVSALAARSISQNIYLLITVILATIGFIALLEWLIRKEWIKPGSLIFFIGSMILAISSWTWLANTEVTPIQVEIVEPRNGTNVEGHRSLISGKVNDPDAQVYVLVHPTAWSDIWVQDSPLVDHNGNWQVKAYLGSPSEGIAQDFEILAIATNENFLKTLATGNWLRTGSISSDNVPKNTNRSNIVTVARKS